MILLIMYLVLFGCKYLHHPLTKVNDDPAAWHESAWPHAIKSIYIYVYKCLAYPQAPVLWPEWALHYCDCPGYMV